MFLLLAGGIVLLKIFFLLCRSRDGRRGCFPRSNISLAIQLCLLAYVICNSCFILSALCLLPRSLYQVSFNSASRISGDLLFSLFFGALTHHPHLAETAPLHQ